MMRTLIAILIASLATTAYAGCEWRNGFQVCTPTPEPTRQGRTAPAREAAASPRAERSVLVVAPALNGPAVRVVRAVRVRKPVRRVGARVVVGSAKVVRGAVRVAAKVATAPLRVLKRGVERRQARRCERR